MRTYGVQPTIPKAEKDPRDVIMERIKQDAELQPVTMEDKSEAPFYFTILVYIRNLAMNLRFWKWRIVRFLNLSVYIV